MFLFNPAKKRKKKDSSILFAYSRQSPIDIQLWKMANWWPFLSEGEVYFVKLQNWINEWKKSRLFKKQYNEGKT